MNRSKNNIEEKYFDKSEYKNAVKRYAELEKLLAPWIDRTELDPKIKNGAPDGYEQLMEEMFFLGHNIYYTDWMNGDAY